MSFDVVVLEKDEFAHWIAKQAESAQVPIGPAGARGRELFLANGCGACHTIRGTPASGVIGPDLTPVGSRQSLGARLLPNEPETFVRFIAQTQVLKPGVHMPSFGMLPREDLEALGACSPGLMSRSFRCT